MNYVPAVIGTAVGLGDGMIGQVKALSQHTYSHTIFRAGVFALGIVGELAGFLSPDVSYSLMTGATALVASRLPSAFESGPQALGFVGEQAMLGAAVPPPLHGVIQPALARIAGPRAA